MPLIGGGGAGNTTGGAGNPAGVGGSINYIRTSKGTLAYAHSGQVTFNDNASTALNFTTQEVAILANVMICTDDYDADNFAYDLQLNGSSIAKTLFLNTTQTDLTLPVQLLGIVIPPYSTIKLTFQNTQDSTSHTAYGIISGEVY